MSKARLRSPLTVSPSYVVSVLQVLAVTWLAVAPIGCDGPETRTISGADLERGAYLVRHVALCTNCHSERDWAFYSGPSVPGTEGRGGVVGLFGSTEVAPAIDARSLSSTSVWELASLLRRRAAGGEPAIHRSPFLSGLGELTEADALAIAAHLKQLPPDAEDVSSGQAVDVDPRARGEYLVVIGRCVGCHDSDLGGGVEIEIPVGRSHASANITIHATLGIGRMNRTEFIDYFKSLDSPDLLRVGVPEGELNTAMPWPWLAGMEREDLGAIYDYLETLPAVDRGAGVP